MDPAQVLRDFKPSKEFFIGIDSDGCVFDSMEIKHKECFAPMFIKHFGLQAVSKYAREVWEFVNLYSKTRGANRFPALSRSLGLLSARPQVIARKVTCRTQRQSTSGSRARPSSAMRRWRRKSKTGTKVWSRSSVGQMP
jgi:hypothetical protein